MVSAADQKVYELIKDPVKWCEYYLKDPTDPQKPLHLRHYQKDILRCRDKKKVLRMARRLGKTVAMVCEILWKATTFNNKQILVITPYQAQIELIFSFIETMLKDVPELQGAFRVRRSPFHIIEVTNGSVIKGFTAGTRSGQKGEGVRGQDATDMYMDEVDYMGSTAINAIKAIELSRPDVSIWASSTPRGIREQFYQWCTDKSLGFTEFQYTAEVLPHWTEEFGRRLRAECTDLNQYVQEYMAEWGHEAQGVFPPELLDRAKRNYRYVDWQDFKGQFHKGCLSEARPSENIYVMGVDWNGEGVGTRIVVLEWILSHPDVSMINKIRVFYHENISETLNARGIKHHSNLKSVTRVIEVAEQYRCKYIYLDKGYGHTNFELILKNMGNSATERFKEIDFNGRTKIIRPDNRTEEKWTKEFMVGSAARFLENDMIILPNFEDDRYALVGQMRDYRVEKETATGRKKYVDVNEDSLIAMLLGLHAFVMEYSEFTQINRNINDFGYAKGLREIPIRETGDGNEGFKKMFSDSTERGPAFEDLAAKHHMDYRYTRDYRDANDRGPDLDTYDTGRRSRTVNRISNPRRTNLGGSRGRGTRRGF